MKHSNDQDIPATFPFNGTRNRLIIIRLNWEEANTHNI